jgi:DNA-binding transcriptional LysR family regulator
MDRLQSMRVFQRVVEEGGFAAAARKLDLDPAVVTRLVADLEQHLGARLLQRTTRRVSLTPAGEEYVARLRTILGEIDEADASVRGQAQELRGRLRILALPVVCTHMLAPAIVRFHELHPDIQVELRSLDMAEPPLEDYDLTFINSTAPLPSDIVTREVATSEAMLYASPAYLKKHGAPKMPADLQHHAMLQLRLAGTRVDQLRLVHRDSGAEETVPIAPLMSSDLSDPLLRATLEGVGISSNAQDIAGPYVRVGFLQPVLPQWMTGRLSLVAAYPSRQFLPARARVFLEHFIEHLRSNVAQPNGR